jgi:hypothetical protein
MQRVFWWGAFQLGWNRRRGSLAATLKFGSRKSVKLHHNKKDEQTLIFLLWWNFTTPLEPILRKIAEKTSPAT